MVLMLCAACTVRSDYFIILSIVATWTISKEKSLHVLQIGGHALTYTLGLGASIRRNEDYISAVMTPSASVLIRRLRLRIYATTLSRPGL